MPHIDELLGVATLATAGLFAAVVVQPLASDRPAAAAQVRGDAPAMHTGAPPSQPDALVVATTTTPSERVTR